MDAALAEPAKQKNVNYNLRGRVAPASNLVAIGGGKGGVGKSFISSSLAIFLANMGYKTVLVDLDLGAANLHTYLGQPVPKLGINEFLTDSEVKLEETLQATHFPNLHLISGASEVFDVSNVSSQQCSRLMSQLYRLRADYVILDLSAGTHSATLDFFLMATRKLVVFTPDPVSIENAYRFIKAAFYRRIKRFEFQLQLEETISNIMANRQQLGVKSPGDLLHYIHKVDPKNGIQLQHLMDQFQIDIVLNQGRSHRDLDMAPSVKSVCNKYFGIPCELLGQVEYDNAVWQSLRRRKHLLVECPQSRLYTQLMGISRRLVHAQKAQAVI